MIIDKDQFANKKELFKHLVDNYKDIYSAKKSTIKEADGFNFVYQKSTKSDANKADAVVGNPNELILDLVINSCGVLDSHDDVHIKGCWNKTAKETIGSPLLDSHQRRFQDIIGTETEWKVKTVKIEGYSLQCLTMQAKIERSRNPYMFGQYENKYVRQHSVGMRYIKLYLCINSEYEDYSEYKENWDKYIKDVVTLEAVEEQGYFWAVTEAQAIEASAVVFGSNPLTPVISAKNEQKEEPSNDTQNNDEEPLNDTLSLEKQLELIKSLKF